MKYSSKSPIKVTKASASPKQKLSKATNNYVEKNLLNKEVEFWKQKYMELENFCQGKQSYMKMESELQIWKSKYQQLSLRARVAKGSELIIQEYQSRIQELGQQFASTQNYLSISPQKSSEQKPNKELLNLIESQQIEIKQLQDQLEELRQPTKSPNKKEVNTLNSSFSTYNQFTNSLAFSQLQQQQTNKFEFDMKQLEQENQTLNEQLQYYQQTIETLQKTNEQQKSLINQLETQLAQEKLKTLKLIDKQNQNQQDQDIKKYQDEISNLNQKLREFDKQKRIELTLKDEHYSEIITQLKSQIHNQIQSGEMRLNTLQNILKDKQNNQSFGKLAMDNYYQSNSNQSDKVIVRMDSDIKNVKQLIYDDKQKPY